MVLDIYSARLDLWKAVEGDGRLMDLLIIGGGSTRLGGRASDATVGGSANWHRGKVVAC